MEDIKYPQINTSKIFYIMKAIFIYSTNDYI